MSEERESPSALDALVEEFVASVRRGEEPDVEEYARAHPSLADDIREIFPVLAVMEGVKGRRAKGRAETPLPASIAGYRVLREIGSGSMGRVFEGIGGGGERVAIKVVHPHLARERAYAERFRREVEAGGRISHPGVVRTLGSGAVDADEGALPYLVLEYVEGQSLRSLLQEVEVVPERLTRWVGARVADALGAVHSAGVVHGDVKPENVVIRSDETVVLVDLGVSRLSGTEPKPVDHGFAGSLLYAPPEQLAGLEVGPPADLYALGVVLHELTTGRHPSQPAPAAGAPRTSPFLAAVVSTLLSSSPEARFPSARALAGVLDEGERSAWWREREAVAPGTANALEIERSTRLVGRAAEREALERAYEEAFDGRGQVVLIEGEAGVGKTRLVADWAAEIEGRPEAPLVLRAGHRAGAAAVATDALEAVLAGAVAKEDRAPSARGLSPSALLTRCVEALRASSATRPVVVVLEDLHLASAATRDAFLGLARSLRGSRVFLLATQRPPLSPGFAEEAARLPHFTHLALAGLSGPESHELLLQAIPALGPGGRVLSDLGDVARRSHGSPFVLLEYAGRLARGEPADVGSIAAGLREHLVARLAPLSAEERDVLEAAACAGYEHDPLLVARALGRRRLDVLKVFSRLERVHGLVKPAGPRYEFRDHLTQEAVYESLAADRREAFHAALAEAIEVEDWAGQADAGEAAVRAVAACEHAWQGRRPAAAKRSVVRALDVLLDRGEFARAEELAEPILSQPGLLDGADRARALAGLARCRRARSDYSSAERALAEAIRLADQSRDPGLRVQTREMLAGIAADVSDHRRATGLYLQTAAVAHETGDVAAEALARSQYGHSLSYVGGTEEALRECVEAAATLRACGDRSGEGRASRFAARLLVRAGRLDEARPFLERSGVLARADGDREGLGNTLDALAALAFRDSRYAESLDHQVRALDLYREIGRRNMEPSLVSNSALCLLELGRLEEGGARAAEAVAVADSGDRPFPRLEARAVLGDAEAALGHLRAARDAVREAHAAARTLANPYLVAYGTAHFTNVLALLGGFAEAEPALAEAESGLTDLRSPLHESWLLGARGRIAESRGATEAAVEIYARVMAWRERGGVRHGRSALALGRCLLRARRLDEARAALLDALEWAKRSGAVRVGTLARAHLARLPGGDVLAASVALESVERSLAVAERLDAHAALWEASGEEAHLAAARRALDVLVEGAPPECRESMVAEVDLHRRVAEGRRSPS